MDDRNLNNSLMAAKVAQCETIYASLADHLNWLNNQVSSSEGNESHRSTAYESLHSIKSLLAEEEKTLLALRKNLEEEIIQSSKQSKEQLIEKASSKRGLHLHKFESLMNTDQIQVGQLVVGRPAEDWIIVRVLGIDGMKYVVEDADDVEEGSTHERFLVPASHIIQLTSTKFSLNVSSKDYVLPIGLSVLALWPGSTTFYPATIASPEGLGEGFVRLRFEGSADDMILQYSDVIPNKVIVATDPFSSLQ